MNKNITLAVPEPVLKTARRVAAQRNTSVSGLVRDFLESLNRVDPFQVSRAEQKRRRSELAAIRREFAHLPISVGEKPTRSRTYDDARFHRY